MATAMCSPERDAASAASAPSIAVTGATTETAPRPIAAYENVRPTITPTPPTTIQRERARRAAATARPPRRRTAPPRASPISCTQASACSAPISRVERLSKAAAIPHAAAAPERGHDHEHQEMRPGRRQREHDGAEHDAVDHEDARRVRREEAQQHGDRGVADDERDQRSRAASAPAPGPLPSVAWRNSSSPLSTTAGIESRNE